MRYPVRVAHILLALAAAVFLVILNGAAPSAQNVNPGAQSTASTLLQEFKNAEFSWRQAEVGEKLVALNDQSIAPAILELLNSEKRSERCNAGRVLAGLGDDRGLFAVIKELNDKKPRPNRDEECSSCKMPFSPGQIRRDRYYAAHILRIIGDQRAVPALIETLQDDSINYQAASVLADLGDQRAVPALLASLEQEQNNPQGQSGQREMRFWAGFGLLGLKHPKGLATVVEYLRAEQPEKMRGYAVDALGKYGDKNAVPFLIESLHDTAVEVRVNAIMALGRIGDHEVVLALKEALKDTNQETGRARISYGLTAPLFKPMTVQEAAREALKQIETRAQKQ
jgi:HEAT repeat protein